MAAAPNATDAPPLVDPHDLGIVCPLTQGILRDPVVAEDGHDYERAHIEEWFATCRRNGLPVTSPLHGDPMGDRLEPAADKIKEQAQQWLVEARKAGLEEADETACLPMQLPAVNSDLFKHLDRVQQQRAMADLRLHEPSIVVIGNESAGKSTLLERIIGFPVLPRAEGLCTRALLRVHLRRGPYRPARVVLRERDPATGATGAKVPGTDALAALATMCETVKRAMDDAVAREGAAVATRHEVLLEITLETCPNLNVLDLPGLVAADSPHAPMKDATRALAKSVVEAEKGSATYLLVCDGRSQAHLSLATELVTDCAVADDTLGVLTWLDQVRATIGGETDAAAVVRAVQDAGQRVELRWGWLGSASFQPGARQLERATDVAKEVWRLHLLEHSEAGYLRRWQAESERLLTAAVLSQLGLPAVRERVQLVFEAFIAQRWVPRIRQALQARFCELLEQHVALGVPLAAVGAAGAEALRVLAELDGDTIADVEPVYDGDGDGAAQPVAATVLRPPRALGADSSANDTAAPRPTNTANATAEGAPSDGCAVPQPRHGAPRSGSLPALLRALREHASDVVASAPPLDTSLLTPRSADAMQRLLMHRVDSVLRHPSAEWFGLEKPAVCAGVAAIEQRVAAREAEWASATGVGCLVADAAAADEEAWFRKQGAQLVDALAGGASVAEAFIAALQHGASASAARSADRRVDVAVREQLASFGELSNDDQAGLLRLDRFPGLTEQLAGLLRPCLATAIREYRGAAAHVVERVAESCVAVTYELESAPVRCRVAHRDAAAQGRLGHDLVQLWVRTVTRHVRAALSSWRVPPERWVESCALARGVLIEGMAHFVTALEALRSLAERAERLMRERPSTLPSWRIARDATDADVLAALRNHVGATSVDASECTRLTDAAIMAVAEKCPQLQHLDVSCTHGRVTDAAITAVAEKCPQLQHLDVSYTKGKVTDAGIMAVAEKCPQLRHLDLSETGGKVTNAAIMAVAEKCPQLRHLDLSETGFKVTNAAITAVAEKCPQLQHLDVSCTHGRVTDAAITAVAEKCPQLQHLDVSWTDRKVTDAAIMAVAEKCPQLQHLDVSYTKGNVTDAGIMAVAEKCPQLRHLDLSETGGKVTDAAITAVAEKCPQLQHLNVTGTDGKVTDAAIMAVAEKCPQLQHLNVTATGSKVTDAAIMAVAEKCPQLQHLDVSWTYGKVTDAGIMAVAEKCRQLRYLDVSETGSKVTDAAITAVAEKCPQLRHLDVSDTHGEVTAASLRLFPGAVDVVGP